MISTITSPNIFNKLDGASVNTPASHAKVPGSIPVGSI